MENRYTTNTTADIEVSYETVKPETNTYVPTGVKHNQHKPPLDIVINRQFPNALYLASLATAFGHNKYKESDADFTNFKNVEGGSQTYFDAAARHNQDRESNDSESNLPHYIHVLWNVLAAVEMKAQEEGLDVKEFSKKYLSDLHSTK